MEISNLISNDIDITEKKKMLDNACKKLLSLKIILAHILKGCLNEFKDFEPYEIAEKYIEGEPHISEVSVHQDESGKKITGLNVEDNSIDEGLVKYDILFYAFVPALNETVKLIINIEAQNNFTPGYSLLKRGIYYCSRLISAQHNREFDKSKYDDIKKVFSIWICTTAPKDKQNSITRFSFTQQNLVGKANFDLKEYDLIELIMLCLGNDNNTENYTGLIKLLNVLLSENINSTEKKNILQNEYYIKMTQSVEKEVLGMCNISDGIFARGIEQGIEQGIERGIKQGIEQGVKQGVKQGIVQGIEQGIKQGVKQGIVQGIEQTKLESIKNLMKSMNFSLEQAFNALLIPKDEQEKYSKLLKQD